MKKLSLCSVWWRQSFLKTWTSSLPHAWIWRRSDFCCNSSLSHWIRCVTILSLYSLYKMALYKRLFKITGLLKLCCFTEDIFPLSWISYNYTLSWYVQLRGAVLMRIQINKLFSGKIYILILEFLILDFMKNSSRVKSSLLISISYVSNIIKLKT